jgi:hypothetical protein
MTGVTRKRWCTTLVAIGGVSLLFVSEYLSLKGDGSIVSRAEARIGRPLTPLSYAGVARRTTRRAVAGAAVVGAGAAGAYYYGAPAAGCVQVVNAYGQIVYQCP